MTSEEVNNKGEMGSDDDDNDEVTMTSEIVYARGGKEDFVSLVNASNETNGWTRKYRDYDCYRKMLGPTKLHDISARTRIGDYVGSCICLEFDDFAFVSLYYVRPEYRKRGVGCELFKRVVNDDLRKKNVGLNAVKIMSQIYSDKLGFNKRTPWMIDIIKAKNIDKQRIIVCKPKVITVDDISLTVKDGKEVTLQRIIDYDATVAKRRREEFVRQWAVDRIDAVCKVLVNSADEIVGYGCGRLLSVVGYPTFAPMYCDSDDGFKLLFHVLYSCFEEELKERNQINLFMPTIKSTTVQKMLHGIADLEMREQLSPQFTQKIPDHDINKVYCVSDVTMFL
uniref:N-acetyltransferase domain-containing protein n=1 Tax=Elaeophora elaphi TaxID=1147741 RepID=A0A0R3RM68_9BILA